MKLLILTNDDLASLVALNLLLPELTAHEILIGMSDKVGGNQALPQALVDLAHQEKIIRQAISAGEQLPKYFNSTWSTSFESVVNQYHVESVSMNDINQPTGQSRVRSFLPDLILSIRFGKILQQPIIDIPKFGVINLHSGRLPDYQGVMATFWAMLNGECEIGTCLHFIVDKKIDSGDIINQTEIAIDKKKSYLQNVLALYPSGINNIVLSVNRLENGQKLDSKPQRDNSTYYGFPSEQDLQEFANLNYRLFDT